MDRRISFALLLALSLSFVQAQDEEIDPVAPVVFSAPDQTFTNSVSLELHCDTEGAVIRYSTNGRPLTLFNAKTYDGPLEITETTWIRAEASISGSSRVSTLTSGHYIRLAEDVQGFESPLPILVLENFGQGTVPSKTWNQTGADVQQMARQRAQWFLFDRDDSGNSQLAGKPSESSRLGVRVRGAFSSSFPRKPFSVEAWDEEDASTNIKPLGLPAESDWILYSPNAQQDQTMLYNTWLYTLSRSLGGNAVRFRFTEAFVHTGGGPLTMDDHAGMYVLMEKVKRDGDRLDFPRLSEDGTEGGWLLSINRMDPIPVGGYPAPNETTEPQFFHTAGPNRNLQTQPNQIGHGDDIPRQGNAFMNFESPNGYDINEAQRASIEDWFEEFEDVLYGEEFRDPGNGYARYLDADNFIDYFILHDITRNTDGLLISMWIYKEGPEAKLKMGPVWDYDLAYKGAATSSLGLNRDRLWYTRLWQDPDFEQRYGDRWQELRAGPMSDEGIHALIDKQTAEITESVAERHGIGDWPARLTSWKKWLTDRAAAIDKKFEPRPIPAQPSGQIDKGTNVTLKAGTIFSPRDIYFTTDGTDPRAMGGDLAPTATLSVNSITVDETMRVRARVLNGNTWSGLVENWYFVSETPASAANLQISKIHYHPSDPTEEEIAAGFLDGDDFEFLELRNTSDQAVHFGGARFSDGIEFTFDDPSILQSQERLLLVSDRQAFEARYGNELDLTGEYAGNLRNSGERLQLLDFKGEAIIDLTYNDLGSWPRSADGDGPSLVRLDETSDGPFAWRPSVLEDGAPGVDDGITFDRLSNWIEFALGRSPALTVEASEEFLVVRHPRNLAAKGVQVLLEGSEDLIEWQTIPEPKPIDRIYIEDNLVQESLEVSKTRQLHYLRLRVTAPE